MHYVWIVRIRKEGNADVPWDKIEPENHTPYYSVNDMKRFCHGLLFEYPSILEIQITARDNPQEVHVLEQRA